MDRPPSSNLDRPGSGRYAIPNRSIVLKLTLFVGALVALTAGTLITVGYVYTAGVLRDQIDARLSAIADDRQAFLRSELLHLEDRARLVASRTRLRELMDQHDRKAIATDAFRADAVRILDDVRTGAAGFLALWLLDARGSLVASSGPADLVDSVSRGEATQVSVGREHSLVELPRPMSGGYAAVFRTEARSRTGQRVGSVLLAIDIGDIVAQLSDSKRLGETGEFLVGVRSGDRTRFVFPPRFSTQMLEFPASSTPAMNRALEGRFGFMRTLDRLGREVLAAYRPVGYADWGLVAKMDVEEAYAPVLRLRRLLLAIGSTILAFGLAASYLIARQNTRPIRRLAATADAIARGDMDTRIDVASDDEIGVLGQAFARMTDRVARSHADLEERIAERTKDLEAVRDLLDALFGIFTSRLDPENIERTFDSVLRFCHQLGYDLAMISLVDREAGVIRGVRGAGTMSGVVGLTVRSLIGEDILAVAVREGRPVIIADSTLNPRCDQEAVALAGIHGQVILPLISDQVLGTLQVATPEILDSSRLDLRPLETLAHHTARALDGLKQGEEIRRLTQSLEQHAEELGKSEAALREQTRILQSVLDCMREGVVVADREARLLVFNPAAEQILGRAPGLAGADRWNPLYTVYRPDRTTPYEIEELPLFRAIHGEALDQVELYIAHPSSQSGSWMLVNARPLRDDRGEVQGGLVVFHDITRRKNYERRLAVQYAATRVLAEVDSLTEANPQILEIIGQRLDWDLGAIWRANHANHELRCVTLWRAPGCSFPHFEDVTRKIAFAPGFGLPGRVWTSRRGAWITDLTRDPNFPRWAAVSEDGLRSAFAVPILVRGECLGVLEFYSREARPSDEDLLEMMANLGSQIGQFIERHQMHSRVVQSEKLASLGMLSAGVAHEINNPLAYIGNNLAVLERDTRSLLRLIAAYERTRQLLAGSRPELLAEIDDLAEDCDLPYLKENLDKILGSTRQGVKRVAEIVNNLRGFARLDRAAVDQIDIHEALGSALEMIRGRLQRRHIHVEERRGQLPLVAASHVQVNQVFLNLLVNAMQAIESTHREDGKIEIRTSANGEDVIIEISDNGCGIPPEVLPQIFDPFFTTKSIGDGTGLGLSITHGIVQDHAGRMEVESTPGQGTCFRVILPVARR
jgi:signal transduction histidine kinase